MTNRRSPQRAKARSSLLSISGIYKWGWPVRWEACERTIWKRRCACDRDRRGARDANVSSHAPSDYRCPSIAYTLRIDPSHLDIVDITIRLDHAPRSVRLAMKVHPEYDAPYWRYLDSARVEGSPNDGSPSIIREDSTAWRVTLPAGRGTVRYGIHIQLPRGAVRAAWRAFVAPTGALINSPDVFLYLPDFASVPVTLDLLVPDEWRIATSLVPPWHPDRILGA